LFVLKSNSITYRTVTLDQATDSAKIIGKATLNMFHTMKLNISDMRGVSI
jgi:DNA repair protein REV1